MLALDLDPARGRGAADPAAQVSAEADAITRLVTCLGGRCVTDVAPGGGRHVYVLFAAPLPWRELRDLARAMALRFPSVDVAPMSSLGGQISPPGSRHKSGGWRAARGPAAGGQGGRGAAERAGGVERPAGRVRGRAAPGREPGGRAADLDAAELDDAGVPWIPRLGGRVPLGAELEHIARTGRWDRSRYPGRSEARMAVLAAAAARGWQLADVRAATARRLAGPRPAVRAAFGARADGPAPALMSGEKPSTSRAGRKTCADGSLATLEPRPPAPIDGADEFGLIRQWMTRYACAVADPERVRRWGGRAIAVRLVLAAIGQAAMVSGSAVVEFGTRNLALHAALSQRTVARLLACSTPSLTR